jgi:TalC/MipB family fructose-6-phosphate aldolase
MIEQGKKLHAISPRIIVKVPVTSQSWEAVRTLSQANIPVMATAIFQPTQALLAALSGATYVAPYFTRMLKAGDNPLEQIEAMKKMFHHYKLSTKILAATPKTVEQVRACAELGIEAVTIREDLFADLTDTHELTAHAVEQFLDEWNKVHVSGIVF